MSEDELNTLTLWILIPSLSFLVISGLASAIGVPSSIVQRRKVRQVGRLDSLVSEYSERVDITVDWMDFRDLSRPYIYDILGRRGWICLDEVVDGNSWNMRFGYRPAEVGSDARTRLAGELASATPDTGGRYFLDLSQYTAVSKDEIGRAITSAGWVIDRAASVADTATLIASSDETENMAIPVGGTVPLGVLRQNEAVVAHAEHVRRETGFDPLADPELRALRSENNRYARRYSRHAWVAGVGWATGVAFLLLGVSGDLKRSSGGNDFPLYSAVLGCALLAVALVFTITAWRVRRLRTKAIGDRLTAVKELNKLHLRTRND